MTSEYGQERDTVGESSDEPATGSTPPARSGPVLPPSSPPAPVPAPSSTPAPAAPAQPQQSLADRLSLRYQQAPGASPPRSAPPGPPAQPALSHGWQPGPSIGRPSVYAYGPGPAGPDTPPAYPAPQVLPAYPAPPARRRLAWPGVLALLLVVVLGAFAGYQAYRVDQLEGRLAAADQRWARAQAGDSKRLDNLEGRASDLERAASTEFNPEEIASAVLPSVFRVRAGDYTGTAFAVGKPTKGGGTNLFTNFHVVAQVYDRGERKVYLERKDQRYPAKIVKVDRDHDIAQLQTTSTFTGLVTAPEKVKSGQPIVVVGAPLGLEDTVTTGVVSAFRKLDDGSGTVIQFDAPINPGNSGGPVINAAKQVVGIASAKARNAEGIGLAIPIETACDQFAIC